jgi:mono/diheme cytochrome c family protein
MMRIIPWWAVVIAALLLGSPRSAAAQALVAPTQDPVAGSRVFGEKGCARCHPINGVGGQGAPDLGRRAGSRGFYDLAAALWNHLPQMAERMRQLGIPRPRLEAGETGDLIAFLSTLDYFDPPGNVDSGRRLFTTRRCIVCHPTR